MNLPDFHQQIENSGITTESIFEVKLINFYCHVINAMHREKEEQSPIDRKTVKGKEEKGDFNPLKQFYLHLP